MDGFAINAEETFGASESNPAEIKIIGAVHIGETPRIGIGRGEAVAVATGSHMPEGADAVVMSEYTRVVGERLEVVTSVVPGENVSKRGEDVKKGAVVIKKGTRIRPQDIGILSALGIHEVSVTKKPRVAVISTGDELIDPGEEWIKGKIYDINRHMTKAEIIEAGGVPLDFGIVRDDSDEIRESLVRALARSDIVIISAGTSVGERDLVPNILEEIGEPGLLVHGVSLRPGYPTGLAVVDEKPVVSLPGYPVSNAMAFREIVRPLLARFLDTNINVEATVRARLSRRVAAPGGLRTCVRVTLSGDKDNLVAEPIAASGAGLISSLTKADGLLIISEDSEGVDVGEEADIVLLRPLKDR
jgi:molybdopterin molybdotransferase